MDDGGHAVPVPDHAALRDPVHGVGHRDRRRPRVHGQRRTRSARPLLGRARLVVHGLGVERTASRRRHPCPRRRHTHTRRPADRHRLHATAGRAARRTAASRCSRDLRRQRFTVIDHDRVQPGRPHRDHRHPRPRAGAADVTRRPDQSLPARMGHGHHRRRPHRRRLGGMEPQPPDRNPRAYALVAERALVWHVSANTADGGPKREQRTLRQVRLVLGASAKHARSRFRPSVGAVVVEVVSAQAHRGRCGNVARGHHFSGDRRQAAKQRLDLVIVERVESAAVPACRWCPRCAV